MAKVIYENVGGEDEGVQEVAMVGREAPKFVGTVYRDGKFEEVKLEDLRGKWVVLYFYPADFTFVCPTELGGLAEKYAEFGEKNTEVVGVSTDTEFAHMMWAQTSPTIGKVKFPLLADPTGEVSMAYGVYNPETGLAERGRFIIDPEGVLKSMEITCEPLGRNVEEVMRQVVALQYLKENPGMACPVNWKAGEEGIRTGEEEVGKI